MANKPLPIFRLRVRDALGNVTYIFRNRLGDVRYISGKETPLALSNLLGDVAAETSFKLEDAAGDAEAAKIVRAVLAKQWAKNPGQCPTVELI